MSKKTNESPTAVSGNDIHEFSILCQKKGLPVKTYLSIGALISYWDESKDFKSEREALEYATELVNQGLPSEEIIDNLLRKLNPD